MRSTRLTMLSCVLGLLLACGGGGGDAPDADDDVPDTGTSNPDAPRAPDAMTTAPQGPSRIVQTAGGGVAQSAGYRLSLRIGAPQPAGTATSSATTVRVGPFAGR